MKSSLVVLLVMALVGLTGCNKGTPGGPGAASPSARTDATFNLVVPGTTTLKQGEAKQVLISVTRGKQFQEEVTLKFADLPKGVTLHHPSSVIKHGDTEAKLTLTAAEDAAVGDFTIKVIGHPTKGADAAHEFKITVEKK